MRPIAFFIVGDGSVLTVATTLIVDPRCSRSALVCKELCRSESRLAPKMSANAKVIALVRLTPAKKIERRSPKNTTVQAEKRLCATAPIQIAAARASALLSTTDEVLF